MKFFFIALLIFPQLLFSYTFERGRNGKTLHWKDGISQITFYVNTRNAKGISSEKVLNILDSAVREWNNSSPVQISLALSDGKFISGANNIYFLSQANDSFSSFGDGVLAVTQNSFDDSGNILTSDIIVSDKFSLEVNDETKDEYLGNIFTHELGHALGLGHSEVKDSTMIYTALRGQKTLHADDISGIHAIYDAGNFGEIYGKVVGGNKLIGVLGAHVQAISKNTGKVAAGVLSDADGSFRLRGLPKNDSYYLYVGPSKMLSYAPVYYSEAKRNFCPSGTSYRGSFFKACGPSANGLPEEIVLKNNFDDVNVGLVSIRCEFDISSDYLDVKNDAHSFFTPRNQSGSFTGYFSSADISNARSDQFKIDLTHHTPSPNEFFDIKTVAQAFYSKASFVMTIKRGSEMPIKVSPSVDTDGNTNLDLIGRIALSLTPSENIFEIRIIPTTATGTNLYPNDSLMKENLNFYFVSYGISELANGNYLNLVLDEPYLMDNSECPDAPYTYSIKATIESKGQSRDKRSNLTGLSCATIDTDNNSPPSGPFLIALGIFLSFLLRFVSKIKNPWIPRNSIS